MKKLALTFTLIFVVCALFAQTQPASGEKHSAQELSLKLQNPVAKMISIPFQFNFLQGFGQYNGTQFLTNFQPVIPFTIGKVNVITRTIVPFIENRNVLSAGSTQFGLSDINLSIFLSPAEVGKLIWGVGPAFSLPTASKPYFGSEKWGVGPSLVLLKQSKGISALVLIRQMWSFGGNEDRDNFSLFFINPGFGYAFKSGASLGMNFELSDDFKRDNDTQFYLNLSAGCVTAFGKRPVQFNLSPRIPIGKNTPGDWGLRVGVSLVFPK